MSADGLTALVVVLRTSSDQPVTFSVTGDAAAPQGATLGPWDRLYLSDPQPVRQAQVTVNSPTIACRHYIENGCTFIVLLWAPDKMIPDAAGFGSAAQFTVTASQLNSTSNVDAKVYVVPPPVVLIHGIWSSAAESWRPFKIWLEARFPHQIIVEADYGGVSYRTFKEPLTQRVFGRAIAVALKKANAAGIAARRVDVVAHSMGGLVARYFLDCGPIHCADQPPWPAYFVYRPVHTLIFVGTPHSGSPLAVALWQNRTAYPALLRSSAMLAYCVFSPCRFDELFRKLGKEIGTGVEKLQTGIGPASAPLADYRYIVGVAPSALGLPSSISENLLNAVIKAYLPTETISSLMGGLPNDTIVPAWSQADGVGPKVQIQGLIHAVLPLTTRA